MIQLEKLLDGSATGRNFDKLMALVLDTGGQTAGIRFGAVTLTFTASADSALATVTHGLGTTPVAVFVSNTVVVAAHSVTGFAEVPGATTFRVFGRSDGAFTGTSVHYWLAIG